MAFDLNAIGGYGNGELGDVIDPQDTPWQSCAFTTWGGTTLTLKNVTYDDTVAENNDFSAWPAGTKVLLIVGRYDAEWDSGIRRGKWGVFTITPQEYQYAGEGEYNLVVSLDRPFVAEDTGQTDGFLVKIAQYRNLTLNSGCTLSAVQSLGEVNGAYGGFVALMCSETLTFNGGHIDLRGYFGRPHSGKTDQEEYGTLDTDKYAGWENSHTKDCLLLSGGDGLAFIVAQNIVVADDSSRIGNPTTAGVAYCRGAADSPNRPAGVTNLGGSTIFMVAGSFTNFTPKFIAKYRTGTDAANANKGLGRCYIASGTKLTNDEGLYAYDNISKPSVVTDTLKIKDFGDGSSGAWTRDIRYLKSNFAAVTAFSANRKVLTVKNMTTDGEPLFAPGALVMVHAKNKDSTNTKHTGRFYLAKILGVNGNDITLDTAAPYNTFDKWLDTYFVQILTIPQFTNFNGRTQLADPFTPKWSDQNGYGGMLAIAVNGTCDLQSKTLHAMGCGGGAAYGANGLTHIGNAQDNDRLPIGQGDGSIFILAKNLVMDENTRIGSRFSGADNGSGSYGGSGGDPISQDKVQGGGYHGSAYTGGRGINGQGGHGGGGGAGGHNGNYHKGGYGSNGYINAKIETNYSLQGAHIMIIADTITGFNQAAISTGGNGSSRIAPQGDNSINEPYAYGGKGTAGYGGGGAATHNAGGRAYGGGGGYNGGGAGGTCTTCDDSYGAGGGASGWAFIYCNNVVDQDTIDTDPDAIEPDY